MGMGKKNPGSVSDIQIGAVELKNAITDDRALISDANTARAAADHVLQIQHLDATGKVLPAGDAASNSVFVQLSQDGTNEVDATHPVPISATLAANALGNPLFTQLSQDGTNAMDATHPLVISATLAANTLANPLFTQISQDGTSAVSGSKPLPISATLAANTLGNPMFVQISQDGTNAVDASNPLAISATAAANTLANPLFTQLSQDGTNAMDATHPISISATLAANTLGNPMFVQISQDGTNAVDASNPLAISATAAANATANRIFVSSNIDQVAGATITAANPLFAELTDGGAVISTSNPLSVNITDGTNPISILAAISDNIALSNNALVTASVMLGYDGATLDMLRTGASNELQVTDVATRPGEDSGNDRRKIFVDAINTNVPAKTTTTITGALDVILASVEVVDYPNLTLTVMNTHGANAFTACYVEFSPDNSTWELWDSTTFTTLAISAIKSMQISGNSRRYMRVRATAATNAGSSDVWITANVG